jgi:hypothetical protein
MTVKKSDETATYPMRWSIEMAGDAARAARARTMSLAAWLREAVREKLERDRSQS